MFKGLVSLLRLSLYGNKIKAIDSQAFFGIGSNLTRINLGGNHLTAVPSQSLKNLASLQVTLSKIIRYYYLLLILK